MNTIVDTELYGVVGDPESSFTPEKVRNTLDDANGADVIFRVNSPGGEAFTGMAIANMVAQYSGHVTLIVEGLIASAATLLMTSSDNVIMLQGSMAMIHDPATITFGTSKEHDASSVMLNKLARQAVLKYADRTGKSVAYIERKMEATSWYTAAEAVSEGLADEVQEGPTMVAPEFDYSVYDNFTVASALTPQLFPRGSIKTRKGKVKMTTKTTRKKVVKAPPMQTPAGSAVMSASDLKAEIQMRCEAINMEADAELRITRDLMARNDVTVQMIKDAILAEMTTDNRPSPSGRPPISQSHATMDNPEFASQAISDAMLARMNGTRPERGSPAAELAGMSIVQMGERWLESHNVNPRSKGDRATLKKVMTFKPEMSFGYHATTDFPGLVAETLDKRLMAQTALYTSPLVRLAMAQDWNGYNTSTFHGIGGLSALHDYNEAGEIKGISLDEETQIGWAGVNAGQFAISEKLMRGDPFGVMRDQSRNAARAAAKTINSKHRAKILGSDGKGGRLRDNKTLFHADRGNIAPTGSDLTVTSLGEGRKHIRQVPGIGETEAIGLSTKFLLVGPEQETEAEKLMKDITAQSVSEVNPFGGKLELLVDPAIENSSWYLFADDAQSPITAAGYMDDAEGPQVDIDEDFDILGMRFRIVLRYGVALIGWRGSWFNPGT